MRMKNHDLTQIGLASDVASIPFAFAANPIAEIFVTPLQG
jgi:hypothetical protein